MTMLLSTHSMALGLGPDIVLATGMWARHKKTQETEN